MKKLICKVLTNHYITTLSKLTFSYVYMYIYLSKYKCMQNASESEDSNEQQLNIIYKTHLINNWCKSFTIHHANNTYITIRVSWLHCNKSSQKWKPSHGFPGCYHTAWQQRSCHRLQTSLSTSKGLLAYHYHHILISLTYKHVQYPTIALVWCDSDHPAYNHLDPVHYTCSYEWPMVMNYSTTHLIQSE